MFLGSYRPSFDLKTRRIALPKKIRSELAGNETILSFGFEKCIFGYEVQTWESNSANELQKPVTDRDARNNRRFLFSGAERIELDAQGRLVVPGPLLDFAEIKEAYVIGAGDHFEIWDRIGWEKHKKSLTGDAK
ncbi:cell division/cell wall cluster transcriptional repressor MraZ [Candidatus Curtissbacteria bacterium]|nr:cell division/cell wall cluster transcriptional repressor MraZ [Candidatus Curtissbacteria bacterium]